MSAMIRSAIKKVVWVGRTASTVFGLALVLALMFGVASMALAGTGVNGVFNLGVPNTVNGLTTLVSGGAGVGPSSPMLRVDNNSNATGATALELQVEPGRPPMTVNSGTKVANFNADKLDNKEAAAFANGVGGKATDADKLDGKSAEQLSRVALMDASSTMNLSQTETTYGSVLSITAPAAGFVRVNGNVTVFNGSLNGGTACTVSCHFLAQVRHINSGILTNDAIGDVRNSSFDNVSLDGVFPVSAGVNTFDIRLFRGGTSGTLQAWFGTLTAEYTPYGSTGSGTLSSTTTMSAAEEGAITKEVPAER